MIYTITFNPSLDYVIAVEDFETGKINRTAKEAIFAGGKGINVSWVLSELGMESTALGFVAGFTGKELENRVQEKGIGTDFIHLNEGFTRINVKLKSKESFQEETEINGQGPLLSEDEIEKLFDKVNSLKPEDYLIISGSIPAGVPQGIYADILKICNNLGVKVIVDASSVLLWNVLEHGPFLIKPNIDELEDLFYRDIDRMDEVIFYAKELKNRGAQNVLVSLGKDGAILIAEDGSVYEMAAPVGEVVNSVGAGDSMVAGFLAGYIESNDFEKALKWGISAGSATAFSEGLAKREEIYNIFNSF